MFLLSGYPWETAACKIIHACACMVAIIMTITIITCRLESILPGIIGGKKNQVISSNDNDGIF